MSSSLTQKKVAAWRQLLVCHSRIIRLIEREFESQGLVPFTFYDILFHLRHAPNREMRFRDINGEVVLSRSALSRCLGRMATEGLVAKLDCPEDPRGLVVQITSKGESELKKAWPIYRNLIVNLFGRHFKENELDFLAQRFAKVADELDNPFV